MAAKEMMDHGKKKKVSCPLPPVNSHQNHQVNACDVIDSSMIMFLKFYSSFFMCHFKKNIVITFFHVSFYVL